MLSWEGRVPPRVAAALAVTFVVLAGGVSSARATGVTRAPRQTVARGTSSNWSGYTVDGSAATYVAGTWTEPAVTCARGENSWSSPWVGIDGDISKTVEQIGTDSDCKSGVPTYYAWYEMYPKSLAVISMVVHVKDSFTGSVSYSSTPSGNFFTLTLTDTTTGSRFSTVQSAKNDARSSAEWIMEGPSSGLLSNFGSVFFSGISATINSLTGPQPITMVTSSGISRAQPSLLSGNAFSVAWQHS